MYSERRGSLIRMGSCMSILLIAEFFPDGISIPAFSTSSVTAELNVCFIQSTELEDVVTPSGTFCAEIETAAVHAMRNIEMNVFFILVIPPACAVALFLFSAHLRRDFT